MSRFIPSCEGQTFSILPGDSSLPAKGRPKIAPRYRGFLSIHPFLRRAGIIFEARVFFPFDSIHPFLRRADAPIWLFSICSTDSSLPTKGSHSVFMRLSAALNTSLCNLHKCRFRLVHIFNMPKNPPHFHFFSNYFYFFQPPSPETFRLRMI